MRSFAVLLTLGLAGSVIAAPAPIAAPGSPVLFNRDPLALHRRSAPSTFTQSILDVLTSSASRLSVKMATIMPSSPITLKSEEDEEDDEDSLADDIEYYGTYGAYEQDVLAWEDRHAQCAEVCRVRTIEGATSGKDALCSSDGLESTLNCAQCIDLTWPEDKFENSAMSEFSRIAAMCVAPSEESSILA